MEPLLRTKSAVSVHRNEYIVFAAVGGLAMIALTWTTIAHASAAASMWVTPTQAATTTMTGGVVGIRPHGYGHASPVLDKRPTARANVKVLRGRTVGSTYVQASNFGSPVVQRPFNFILGAASIIMAGLLGFALRPRRVRATEAQPVVMYAVSGEAPPNKESQPPEAGTPPSNPDTPPEAETPLDATTPPPPRHQPDAPQDPPTTAPMEAVTPLEPGPQQQPEAPSEPPTTQPTKVATPPQATTPPPEAATPPPPAETPPQIPSIFGTPPAAGSPTTPPQPASPPPQPATPPPQPGAPPTGTAFKRCEDPAFQESTIEEFPDKTVANIEEARVLWSSDGYTIVDLRSEFEREEEGTITAESGSIHIPLISAEKVYNAELDKKVILQQPNPQFLEQINSCFSPDDKFIVMDSDGKDRALQALALLDKAGYTSSVCMRGGYNTWQVAFDQQLQRRFPDAQSVMELEAMADKDPVSWLDWATAMDPCPLKVKE